MDGGEPGRLPPQFDINTLQLPVVLPFPAWQKLAEYLGKNPWCEVDPLMRAISQQVQRGIEQRQSAELQQWRGNASAAQQSWQPEGQAMQSGQLPQ